MDFSRNFEVFDRVLNDFWKIVSDFDCIFKIFDGFWGIHKILSTFFKDFDWFFKDFDGFLICFVSDFKIFHRFLGIFFKISKDFRRIFQIFKIELKDFDGFRGISMDFQGIFMIFLMDFQDFVQVCGRKEKTGVMKRNGQLKIGTDPFLLFPKNMPRNPRFFLSWGPAWASAGSDDVFFILDDLENIFDCDADVSSDSSTAPDAAAVAAYRFPFVFKSSLLTTTISCSL